MFFLPKRNTTFTSICNFFTPPSMRNFLKEFSYHTKSERNGFIVLILCLISAIFLPSIYAHFKAKPTTNFTAFQHAILLLEESNSVEKKEKYDASESLNNTPSKTSVPIPFDPNTADKATLIQAGLSSKVAHNIIKYREAGAQYRSAQDLSKVYGMTAQKLAALKPYLNFPVSNKKALASSAPTRPPQPRKKTITPFPFNPNTADNETFAKLGLSEKVIQTINNFRNKKGTFRTPDSFSKIYGLSKEDFQLLKPFIRLEEEKVKKNAAPSKAPTYASEDKKAFAPVMVNKKYQPKKIDINKANIEDWKQLRGIGDWYAKKIVEYRGKLGGFANIEQIAETYSLPDSTFQSIKPFLIPSAPSGKKIKLNTGSVEDIKHPYISWSLAKVIVAYREQHGPFGDVNNLKKIKLLNAETFQKILPYLVLE